MSLDVEGLSCVRCKSYLFSEDDVVYCPICGAPHHRDCYNTLGHCALEELHGTEDEYSREKVLKAFEEANKPKEEPKTQENKKCEFCGNEYGAAMSSCPNCKAPDIKGMGGFITFDPLGGVPADFVLGDGVTANDAKLFIAANTHRYIPKFAQMKSKNRKISWNWLAFLFPAGWFLSRKMYKSGIIACLVSVVSTLLAYPLSLELYSMGYNPMTYNSQMMNELVNRIPEIGKGILLLGFASVVLECILRFVSGMFGDFIYKNHTVNTVKKIKTESEQKLEDYRKKGGVSLIMFMLGFMIVQYIPMLCAMFF